MFTSGKATPAQIDQMLKSGHLTQDQSLQLLKSGQLTPDQVHQLLQSGQIDPEQVKKLLKSGQLTPIEVQQLKVMRNKDLKPEQIQDAIEKAREGTLSEDDIETGRKLLKQQKKVKTGNKDEQEIDSQPDLISEGIDEKEAEADEKELMLSEQNEFFKRIFGIDLQDLNLYGHNIFSRTPEFKNPIKNTPVSNDYIVGPGDVINVLMWGRMDASYGLEVDNEGVIHFPKIGSLTVAGLTYQETKELITRKAEAITGVSVSISMGRLRTIQVFVLGEVRNPGIHTVSSLATAVNGLLAAGGPTLQGSMRNVQVKRQGKIIATLDLYDFLLRGDISTDSRLMPADVIFVPNTEPLVAISGNVRRPAVYELKENDRTLRGAIELGGGLAPRAYKQRIQIKRASANQAEVILDIPFTEIKKHGQVTLQEGDNIHIFSILPRVTNAVYLYGNVQRPGSYAYKKGLRLLDIVPDIESLKVDTSYEYALVKRYNLDDMSTELIPFELGELLSGDTGDKNLPLQPLDEIYIFNRWELEEKPTADISGEIRNPGRYEIHKMKIRDLFFNAGGFTKDAYLETGHLYRRDPRSKKISIHTFDVGKALDGDSENNLQLQDMDRIVIHSVWEYVGRHFVSIHGEINNPETYPYADNMTAKDLILLAGQVKESAYLDDAELIRFDIVDGKTVHTSLLTFNIHLALQEDPTHNLRLQPWDIINIKQIPEWGESREVTIKGEVAFPGEYSIRKGEKLSHIFERAGGFTNMAYYRGAIFTRKSVQELQQKRIDELVDRLSREVAQIATSEIAGALSEEDIKGEQVLMRAQQTIISRLKMSKATGRVVMKLAPGPAFNGSSYNLTLEDGDQLYIPPKPDTVDVAGEVFNATSLIYDSSNPEVGYYLSQTGGPTKYANPKQMFILRADGTVYSKSGTGSSNVWLSSFEDTPLYPGDTIVVPPKLIHTRLKREIKDITSIIYQMAVSAGIIINQVFDD